MSGTSKEEATHTVEDIDAFLATLRFDALSSTRYVQVLADKYSETRPELAREFARLLRAAGDLNGRLCVDLGSGLGLLPLVLRWVGVRNVIGVDWDPAFVAAARELGRRARLDVEFRQASAEDAIAQTVAAWDAVFSSNFIEHVYHLQEHFHGVFSSLAPGGVYLAATGVSGLHIPAVVHYGRTHRRYEVGQPASAGFRARRLEVIRGVRPDLDAQQAALLARRTRGWAGAELVAVVQGAQGSAVPRREQWWSLNTCNPSDGYWPDRLMSPRTALNKMRRAGFEATLMPPAQLPPSAAPPSAREFFRRFIGEHAPGPIPFFLARGFTLVGRKPPTPADSERAS